MESATTLQDRSGIETGPAPVVASREEPVAFPVSKLETWGILILFTLFYTLVGYKIVADLHVVSFDALDRLTRAFMVWYNDPPKLAAIGFSMPPIGTFILLPFAAIRELVTSGLALPLSAGIFGALTLTTVNRMFAVADMARGGRLLIVLLVGLNPMFAYYSMNGTGDAAYLFFAGFGLFCLVGWGRNGSARYLIGAGLAFALASLTDYEFIAWSLLIALIIAWSLNSRERDPDEIEGSTIAFLAPIAYALGIWIFFNAIVLGDPFEWVALASETTPVNAVTSSAPGFDLFDAIGNVLRIELIFPATLLAAPLLLFGFGGNRDVVSIGFALLILLNMGYQLVGAAIEGSVDVIELRDALPGMMAGIAGMAYLYLRSPDSRGLVWVMTVALSVVGLATAWWQMESYPHQNLEQAFTRAVSTGEDQEGTTSRGGYQVGVAPEREIAHFIRDQQIPDNEILTDNSRTYGVIAINGYPEQFFDRVDRGDEEWQSVLEDPEGKVEFMLVANDDADLILDRYPGALDGDVPFLEPVAQNDRYALVRVVEPTTSTTDSSGETSSGSTSTSSSSSSSTTTDQGGNVGSAPPLSTTPPSGSGG